MTTTTTGITLGTYDDHTPAVWPACTGGLITGRTGAGKTQACLRLATQITATMPTALHIAPAPTDLTTGVRRGGVHPIAARAETLAQIVRLRRAHHLDQPQGWPTHADPLHLVVLDEITHVLDHASEDTRHAWTHVATAGPAVGVLIIATALSDTLSSFGGDSTLRATLTAGATLTLHHETLGRGTLRPTSHAHPRCVELPPTPH